MRGVIIAVFLCVLAVGCQGPSLEIAGEKFRGRGSDDAALGSLGQKTGNLKYHYDNNAPLHFPEGKVQPSKTTEMFEEKTSKALSEVKASEPTSRLSGRIATSQSSHRTGNYIVLRLPTESIVNALNDQKSNEWARSQAMIFGKSTRVVSGIAVAYGYSSEESKKLETSANVSLEEVNGGFNIVTEDSTKVRLSDGTIFAYKLSRPVWGRNAKTGEIEVKTLITDRFGFDEGAPAGMSFDPNRVPPLRTK